MSYRTEGVERKPSMTLSPLISKVEEGKAWKLDSIIVPKGPRWDLMEGIRSWPYEVTSRILLPTRSSMWTQTWNLVSEYPYPYIEAALLVICTKQLDNPIGYCLELSCLPRTPAPAITGYCFSRKLTYDT